MRIGKFLVVFFFAFIILAVLAGVVIVMLPLSVTMTNPVWCSPALWGSIIAVFSGTIALIASLQQPEPEF